MDLSIPPVLLFLREGAETLPYDVKAQPKGKLEFMLLLVVQKGFSLRRGSAVGGGEV